MPGQRKRGYTVLERGMSGGVPMASPRESKVSTKIAVPSPIEQKSQRTRNSTRPPPAPKNSREFDAQAFLATIGEGRNPTRRNRNIGTPKSGHGQDNRMTVPEVAHGDHVFWERIDSATEVSRTVSGRVLRFFIQPTRADCIHACTVDDIARLMSNVPPADLGRA